MEGQVGYFRRNYLTPVPNVATLEDLNRQVAGFEEREMDRRIGSRIRTIGQDFARGPKSAAAAGRRVRDGDDVRAAGRPL